MTPTSHDTFAAFVGIDWADAKHDGCLQAAGSAKRECFQLEHTPEAIDAWVTTLRTRFNGQPIAVCLELDKGPLVSALRKYDFLVLFPINPLTLARYREAFTPSRAKDAPIFCDFLTRWPTLKAVQLARRSTLESFFRDHHVRSPEVIARRLQAIRAALPLTTDEGVIAPNVLLVQALVAQLRVTLQAIADFATAIAQRAQSHPDFPLFQTLPGAGPVFASRLLVAFGEQRERYPSATALQKYAGIAPVTERSGKQAWVHWRLQCPKFLRQSFLEWAAESIRHSFWAQVYYQQQREKGKTHQAAVRALAFKWIRILYRCWQERTPYEESTYLQALTRRGSSLIHNLAKAS